VVRPLRLHNTLNDSGELSVERGEKIGVVHSPPFTPHSPLRKGATIRKETKHT